MKALLIIAHGSRLDSANKEVKNLVAKIQEVSGATFQMVEQAFLEIAEPKPQTQIENLVSLGMKEIVLFPYFLASGRHVTEDIPDIVNWGKENYPGVSFKNTKHMGSLPGIEEMILNEAVQKTDVGQH